MMPSNADEKSYARRTSIWRKIHLDIPLLLGLLALMSISLMIVYGASGLSVGMVKRQAIHIIISVLVMFGVAQISPDTLRHYCKDGLLHPIRDSSGRRLFTDKDVTRIREVYLENMTRRPSAAVVA